MNKFRFILALLVSLAAIAGIGWWQWDAQQWVKFTAADGTYSYSHPRAWQSETQVSRDPQHLDKNDGIKLRTYIPDLQYCQSLSTCVAREFHTVPAWMWRSDQLAYTRTDLPVSGRVAKTDYYVQRRDSGENVDDTYWIYRDGVLVQIDYGSTISRRVDERTMRRLLASLFVNTTALRAEVARMELTEWGVGQASTTWHKYQHPTIGFSLMMPNPQENISENAESGQVSFIKYQLHSACDDLMACANKLRQAAWDKSKTTSEYYEVTGVDNNGAGRASYTERHDKYRQVHDIYLRQGRLLELTWGVSMVDTKTTELYQAVMRTLKFN